MDVDAPEGLSGDDANAANAARGTMNTIDAMEIDPPAKQPQQMPRQEQQQQQQQQQQPRDSPSPPQSPSPPTPPPAAVHQVYTPQFSPAIERLIMRHENGEAGNNGDNGEHFTQILAKHGIRTISLGFRPLSAEELSRPRTMPMPVARKSPPPRKTRRGTPDSDDTISDPGLPEEVSAEASALASSRSASSGAVLGPVCTVCDRPGRSIFNPLVPCRRCGLRWHRLCHDPVIADYVAAAAAAEDDARVAAAAAAGGINGVNSSGSSHSPASPADAGSSGYSSSGSGWSCPSCIAATTAETEARRAQHARAVRPANALSLPTCPPPPAHHNLVRLNRQQRHNYLAGLSRPDLQQWLLYAMEKHPELAVYPPRARQPPPAAARAVARPATATAAAAAAAAGAGRRGRPPRSIFLPPLPAGMAPAHGGRVTAAAVMSATKNSSEYRDKIMQSIRKGHAESVAEAERKERAEKIAAGLHVPRRRGRPRKDEAAAEAAARLTAVQQQQPLPVQNLPLPLPVHTMRMPRMASGSQTARPLPAQPAAQSMHVPVPVPVPVRAPPRPTSPSHIPAFEPTPVDPEEEDPMGLMENWPKPGQGLYARLGPDWDTGNVNGNVNGNGNGGDDDSSNLIGRALVSTKDHASFSSMVFNSAGRKVMENGAPMLAL